MPRAGLTRASVVELALGVVDDGGVRGFESLTLAAVAARAGVAVPSLYKHVGSLADLRREVAVVAVRGLTSDLEDATAGATGSDAVVRLAHAVRRHARAQPGRYAAAQVAPDALDPADAPLRSAAERTTRVVAAALAASGIRSPGDARAHADGAPISGTELVHTVRVVRAAVHGFVALELGGGFGLPDDVDESFDHLVATLVTGLPHGVALDPAPASDAP